MFASGERQDLSKNGELYGVGTSLTLIPLSPVGLKTNLQSPGKLFRVPWTASRSNQPILKEINPEYSSEGLMLNLKFQYFGHLMGRTESLEKILILGKIEGGRRRGRQRMVGWHSPTRWTWIWANSGRWWRTGKPGVLQSLESQSQKQLNDWRELAEGGQNPVLKPVWWFPGRPCLQDLTLFWNITQS